MKLSARTQSRRPTEYLIAALNGDRVLEVYDVHDFAALTDIDMVSKVNPTRLLDARLNHNPRLTQGVVDRRLQVGKVFALVVNGVDAVMKVKEVSRHGPATAKGPASFLRVNSG